MKKRGLALGGIDHDLPLDVVQGVVLQGQARRPKGSNGILNLLASHGHLNLEVIVLTRRKKSKRIILKRDLNFEIQKGFSQLQFFLKELTAVDVMSEWATSSSPLTDIPTASAMGDRSPRGISWSSASSLAIKNSPMASATGPRTASIVAVLMIQKSKDTKEKNNIRITKSKNWKRNDEMPPLHSPSINQSRAIPRIAHRHEVKEEERRRRNLKEK